MRTRCVIVDDDDVTRRGLVELLADRAELEVVGGLTHEEALVWDTEWGEVDVALVDAADPNRDDDQFPGVRVVEAIRRRRSKGEATVIVITGHFFDDALRRRMREAEADFFYHRSEFQKATALYAAVLHPEQAEFGVPPATDPESVFRLGVTPATRVNQAVDHSLASGLAEALRERGGERSRRWGRLRREFNAVARLNPVNADGTVPDRLQAEPSVHQVERFLGWATRIKGDSWRG